MALRTRHLFVDQGADEDIVLPVADVDLTGGRLAMQVRRTHSAPTSLLDLGITQGTSVSAAADGAGVEISIAGVATSATEAGDWVYDLVLVRPDGGRVRLYEGDFHIRPEVTTR